MDIDLNAGFTPSHAYDLIANDIQHPDDPHIREALSFFKAMSLASDVTIQPKITLVCENSDSQQFGIVRDTEGHLDWKPGDGLAVGEYMTTPHDNHIHLQITTPIQALYDKAVARMRAFLLNAAILDRQNREALVEVVKKRKATNGKAGSNTNKKTASKKIITDTPVQKDETQSKLDELRKRLKGE